MSNVENITIVKILSQNLEICGHLQATTGDDGFYW